MASHTGKYDLRLLLFQTSQNLANYQILSWSTVRNGTVLYDVIIRSTPPRLGSTSYYYVCHLTVDAKPVRVLERKLRSYDARHRRMDRVKLIRIDK